MDNTHSAGGTSPEGTREDGVHLLGVVVGIREAGATVIGTSVMPR